MERQGCQASRTIASARSLGQGGSAQSKSRMRPKCVSVIDAGIVVTFEWPCRDGDSCSAAGAREFIKQESIFSGPFQHNLPFREQWFSDAAVTILWLASQCSEAIAGQCLVCCWNVLAASIGPNE